MRSHARIIRLGTALVFLLGMSAASAWGATVTLIDENFAGFGVNENYSGTAVTWRDNDGSPNGFERYNAPSSVRGTDATYDHDDNPLTPDITIVGGLEVNHQLGNMTLTGSFTLPWSVIEGGELLLEFGADARGGTQWTSTVELYNVTDGRSILSPTPIVYGTPTSNPDWKRNLFAIPVTELDGADTVELRFTTTGDSGQGLQLTNLGLTGEVPEPATMALLVLASGAMGGYIRRRRT